MIQSWAPDQLYRHHYSHYSYFMSLVITSFFEKVILCPLATDKTGMACIRLTLFVNNQNQVDRVLIHQVRLITHSMH